MSVTPGAVAPPSLRAFYVWLEGFEEHKKVVNAVSLGAAKTQFLHDISDPCPDVKYTDIKGCVASRRYKGPWQTEEFMRVTDYRGIPYARVGQVFRYRDSFGVIMGPCRGGGALLSVFFTTGKWAGKRMSIHPAEIIICVTKTASIVLRKAKYYEARHLEVPEE